MFIFQLITDPGGKFKSAAAYYFSLRVGARLLHNILVQFFIVLSNLYYCEPCITLCIKGLDILNK